MRFSPTAWVFAAVTFVAVAAGAFASPGTDAIRPVIVPSVPAAPRGVPAPRVPEAIASLAPKGAGLYVGAVAPGTIVPLSRLPRLPRKSLALTVTPKTAHSPHRMAANGSYINITGTNCSTGALGDDFSVGCSLSWQATDMPSTDRKQDYYISPGTGNEVSTNATATGGTYTATTGTAHNTTLVLGTSIFGTYDVTKSEWIAVVYVNAGPVFTITVYSDPYHTEETYQFDAAASENAYIYLQNVAQGDYYVVGVNQTGVNPNCVFMAPVPTPSPYTYPSNDFCNLTSSSGIQAAGGNLSVTWPISSSYAAGNYSIEVYDLTQGERLGQVQVSITGSSGIVLTTYPDDSGANVNPSPAAPVAGATPSTIVDWDGGSAPGPRDESVSGIKASVTGLQNGSNYLWTLSDPQGQVASQATGTIASNTGSNTFTFDTLAGGPIAYLEPPGRYPAKSWVIQLYNTTSKAVVASQGFQVLGYSTETQFDTAGTLGTSLSLTPSGTVNGTASSLEITNESNVVFNNMGDSLSNLLFTTGPDFNVSNTTGYGVFVSTNQTSLCNTTCTTTGTDTSTGNIWNVTIKCSSGTLSTKGECNVQMTPSASNIFLAPGATVVVNGLYWFMDTGANCGNACAGGTSEFPEHGLHWSCVETVTGCTSDTSDLASTTVYFDSTASSQSGTAYFRIVGADNDSTAYTSASPAPAVPFVNAQFFQSYFPQMDYNFTSPYAAPKSTTENASYTNTLAFILKNTGTSSVREVAVTSPSIFHTQSELWIVNNNNWWSFGTCPSNFKAGTICYVPPNASGNVLASGGSSTINVYMEWPLQSYPFTDFQVFECTSTSLATCEGTTGQWTQMTPTSGEGETTLDGVYTVDGLASAAYSLTASDMTAYFSPSTVAQGATPTLGFTYQNTSTSVDAMPDSVDAVVLEAPNTTVNLNSTPTVSAAGWSYLGSYKPNNNSSIQYWFGLCATQFTNGSATSNNAGPPTSLANGDTYPLTATWPSLDNPTTCGTDTDAIKAGGTLTVSNMTFQNFNTTGSQTWHIYAHGINGGGWSTGQPLTLTVNSAAANVWFNQVNGVATTSNSVATVSSSPNSYQYAIENTSQSTDITGVAITLPGTDINGQNAYDGTNWWDIPSITTAVTLSYAGGNNPDCTLSTNTSYTYNATSGGANGQLYITCTNFKPNYTLYVNLPNTTTNPEEENDSYLFPATIQTSAAPTPGPGTAAGTQWVGSDEITDEFSLGLDIVVDPSNPGPGGSTPVVNCQNTCAFSGSTIDFGNIADSTTYTFSDVVRTSVIYTGATSAGHNLDLYVSASQNPTNTSGSPTNELLTEVDQANSNNSNLSYLTTSYTVIPTTSPGLEVATAPETKSSTGYDVINSFEVAMGASDVITSRIVTLTYTVIPN